MGSRAGALEIRHLDREREDLDRILPKLVALAELLGPREGRPILTVERLKRLLEINENILVVAEVGGEIVGHVMLGQIFTIYDNYALIAETVVHPDHGNRKIAQEMLIYLFMVAKQKGHRSIALTCSSEPEREIARKLYDRMGFKLWPTNFLVVQL